MKIKYHFLPGDKVRHKSGKTGTVDHLSTWAVWVSTASGGIEPWSKSCTYHMYTPIFSILKTKAQNVIKKYFSI